jgi:serpin B
MRTKGTNVALWGILFCALSASLLFGDQKNEKVTVVSGNNAFAFDLYAKLKSEKGNIFFSPYSISTALAMTYAGAKGNTEKQMAQTLHFGTDQELFHRAFAEVQARINDIQKKETVKLNVTNGLWMQNGYTFLPSFLERTSRNYQAGFNYVDYVKETEKARVSINTWVDEKTNNKIQELLQKGVLNVSTRLVLTNAIYFKGSWAQKFDSTQTKEQIFWTTPKDSVQAKMMNLRGKEFGYVKTPKVECVEIPYVGNDLSMLFLLPAKRDGLFALENKLTQGFVDTLRAGLHKTSVDLCIPKFKTTKDFVLNEKLKSMGMTDAFSSRADFSAMNGKQDLSISAVIHKAFVDVNEAGTEAAAATAVVMMTKSLRKQPPLFLVDHPFLFLIRDTATGSILFMGRIVNPLE